MKTVWMKDILSAFFIIASYISITVITIFSDYDYYMNTPNKLRDLIILYGAIALIVVLGILFFRKQDKDIEKILAKKKDG